MDINTDFSAIQVPPMWAGQDRKLSDGRTVWACGGCTGPDLCAEMRTCQRAFDPDHEPSRIEP